MAANIHAVLLILAVIGPIVAAAATRRGDPSFSVGRRVAGTAGGMTGIAACCGIWKHGCGAGDPTWQWLLPMAAWGVIGLMRLGARERRRFFVVELLLAILLTSHYLDLVHGKDFTGDPGWAQLNGRVDHRRVRVDSVWHTPFTGIYSVQTVPGWAASPLDGL